MTLLTGEELSMVRQNYADNIGQIQTPEIMECVMTLALIILRSLGDSLPILISFEAFLEREITAQN